MKVFILISVITIATSSVIIEPKENKNKTVVVESTTENPKIERLSDINKALLSAENLEEMVSAAFNWEEFGGGYNPYENMRWPFGYGNSNSNGNRYGNGYGNRYNNRYGNGYWNAYPNGYNNNNGNEYGNGFGNEYGNRNGYKYGNGYSHVSDNGHGNQGKYLNVKPLTNK